MNTVFSGVRVKYYNICLGIKFINILVLVYKNDADND